jgi:hypothetical protein
MYHRTAVESHWKVVVVQYRISLSLEVRHLVIFCWQTFSYLLQYNVFFLWELGRVTESTPPFFIGRQHYRDYT